MLPLSVVIPTKNSMPYLPRHVEGLQPWLDLAAEVVVVDSFSTDGTVEFLRANLAHPDLRFTNHPPGLYASWNHGIKQISSKYVYIATTGDTITRTGVCQLVEAAESALDPRTHVGKGLAPLVYVTQLLYSFTSGGVSLACSARVPKARTSGANNSRPSSRSRFRTHAANWSSQLLIKQTRPLCISKSPLNRPSPSATLRPRSCNPGVKR